MIHRFDLDDGTAYVDTVTWVSATGRTRVTAYLRFAARLYRHLYRQQRHGAAAQWRNALREERNR